MENYISRLEASYRAESASIRGEVQQLSERVTASESCTTSISMQLKAQATALSTQAQQIEHLTDLLDELENRGRRNNIRETHFKKDHVPILRDRFYPVWFHSVNPEARSKGVSIALHKHLVHTIVDSCIDEQGRYIFLKLKVANSMFTIANWYLPNTNQISTCRALLTQLSDFAEGTLVVGGDFNFTLDPAMDSSSGRSSVRTKELSALKRTFHALRLIDVWRILNPQVQSSKRTTPERCPRPLLPQDCNQEDPDVPQDHQGEDLPHINTTETYVRGDERSTEEIPTDNRPDGYAWNQEGHQISLDFKASDQGFTHNTYEEPTIIPCENSASHSKVPSSDPFLLVLSPSQIVKQNQSVHTEIKPYSCSECGKSFYYDFDLKRHQYIHKVEKPYSCSECGKCFKRKSSFVEHQITHTGEKPFSCSVCGKYFNNKSNLTQHQKIHTGEKPFSCSICGKSFKRKTEVVVHQRSHTGEKPFSCSKCGKSFKRKAEVVGHQRSHTGEKPFSCSECGKWFAQKSHVVRHQRVHTGKKPFSCSECGKLFGQKYGLISHLKSHTGEKPYSCSECGKCYKWKANLVEHQRIHRR
ncbi:uncharacterized protein ACNLHF_021577 [Anomaloglossus baeobatrachus]